MNKTTYMALAGIAYCAVASATPIPVVNGDFANPTAKVTDGYASVLGWSNTGGTAYTDTGVEAAPDGDGEVAFAKGVDAGGYQILSHAMVAGVQYELTWDSRDSYNSDEETVTLLSANATNDAFAATTELASYAGALGEKLVWATNSLSYTATAADAGKYLGISFDNTSSTGSSWIDWDNFAVVSDQDPASPPVGDVTDLLISGPVAGDMELSWTGEAGGSYGVQTNLDLLTANWGTLITGIPGTAGTIVTNIPVGPDKLFYQIISE